MLNISTFSSVMHIFHINLPFKIIKTVFQGHSLVIFVFFNIEQLTKLSKSPKFSFNGRPYLQKSRTNRIFTKTLFGSLER